MVDAEKFDLAIIGAGFHGLAVAKAYLQVNPTSQVVLFDEASSVGGVWAEERLYPKLKTNNVFLHFEYSDMSMAEINDELVEGDNIPGAIVHKYLDTYAEKFNITQRIRFNSKVATAEIQADSKWLLTVSDTRNATHETKVLANRLVVASGPTSEPLMPKLPKAQEFGGKILHSKDFAREASGISSMKSIVLLGGAKSAYDVAYACADAGVQVHWVLRKSGHGPCWMNLPIIGTGPKKKMAEKFITTRFITWFSPCIWGAADGYGWVRWFLNQTWLGRKLLNRFLNKMQDGNLASNRYDDHPETAKLKPWVSAWWIGTGRGVWNYDTKVFDHVKSGRIKVYVSDVSHLSDHTVHLADERSTALPVDAIVCCTGWELTPPLRFLRDGEDMSKELGLPHLTTSPPSPTESKADAEILRRFPILRDQAILQHGERSLPPYDKAIDPDPSSANSRQIAYRLYRLMIPIAHMHTRTVAFAGVTRTASTALIAQTQALWITAFFANRITHLQDSGQKFDANVEYETVLHSRFGRWRYPFGYGHVMPDFFFDSLSYLDLMLRELGCKVWRKAGPLKEITESYGPDDYKGLVEEWMKNQGLQ